MHKISRVLLPMVLAGVCVFAQLSGGAATAAPVARGEALLPGHDLMVLMTLGDLVRGSDAIVIGRVTDILPSQEEVSDHSLHTDVIVRPDSYLYGGSGVQDIAVRVLGGTIGTVGLWVEDQPEFKQGEEVLLFLHRLTLIAPEGIGQQDYYEVYGAIQGKWSYAAGMATDVTGTKASVEVIEAIIADPAMATSNLTVRIEGLGPNETAMLRIGPEIGSLGLGLTTFLHPILGGNTPLTINMNVTLADGYYLMLLDAPGKYFREPRGYAFMVNDLAIVNPTGRDISFKLVPPPSYPATEAIISLSAPYKLGIPMPRVPLWQKLIEPLAIAMGVVIVGIAGVVAWHKLKKKRTGSAG